MASHKAHPQFQQFARITELRKILRLLVQFIIKGTKKKQPDEEVRRGKPGRVPIADTSVPVRLRYSTLLYVDAFANQKLPEACH